MRLLFIVFTLITLLQFQLSLQARAACDDDCNAKCCASVPTPFGSKSVCEPACKSSCEASKAICKGTGGAVSLPTMDLVVKAYNQQCASAFDMVAKAIMQAQPMYAAGSDYMINEAKAVLTQNTGLFDPSEFNGLTIRWCRLSSNVDGMAPDANLVCLSEALFNNANHFLTAVTLGHEMRHIRQYRQMGTNNFKCEYAKQYINCNGCQNRSHPLEKVAYDFEDQVVRPSVIQVFTGAQQAQGGFGVVLQHSTGQVWSVPSSTSRQ